MKRRPAELDGFLNVNKPSGMTSRDVVNRVCRIVGTKRVGHAGTLDPLATGVLVVAIGKATRLVEYVQNQAKTYRAGFLLGQSSDTDDTEGTVTIREVVEPPSLLEIENALVKYLGTIMQLPPKFSAVKVQGQRAYDLARKGAEVEIKPRPVEVHSIAVTEYSFPRLSLDIHCGSGTYIRSIARDLGEDLGVGGLMESLERTAVGVFELKNAVTLETLEEDWKSYVRPLIDACQGMPAVELTDEQWVHFDAGRAFAVAEREAAAPPTGSQDSPPPPQGGRFLGDAEVAVIHAGAFVGIGTWDERAGVLRPTKGGFAPGR
jgi:tRNA pseudouridine55 synthase